MKRCSACQKVYDDDSLNFCTEDGTPLAGIPTVSDPDAGTLKLGDEYDTKPMIVPPRLGMIVVVQLEAGERQTFKENEWAGTIGLSRGLEGFSLRVMPPVPGLTLRYSGHFQKTGDTEFFSEGEFLRGSDEESKRLEGFTIELQGEDAKKYEIFYSAHLQNWKNLREFKSGEFCGTAGRGLRVEAIKVRLTPKS